MQIGNTHCHPLSMHFKRVLIKIQLIFNKVDCNYKKTLHLKNECDAYLA